MSMKQFSLPLLVDTIPESNLKATRKSFPVHFARF